MKQKFKIIFFIIILMLIGLTLFLFIPQKQKITPPPLTFETIEQPGFQLAAANPAFSPRDSQSVFVFQDKLWLIGGLNANNAIYKKQPLDKIADWCRYVFQGKKISNIDFYVNYNQADYFNDIWSSSDGINWTREGEAPWEPSRSVSIIKFNNKLLALNGFSPKEGAKNSIWSSLDGIHWEKQKNGLWEPREGQQVLVFNDKLWVFGGVNYKKNKTFNDIWSSSDGINWTREGEALWSPRWDHSMAVFNGKIFLTGGMDLKDNVFNDEWVSSDGLHWELITSNAVWLPRQGHSLLTASDKLWLIGRLPDPQNTNDQNDVWTSTDGKNWEKFNEAVPWEGREDFGSAVFQNKIWILAGMDSHYRWRNDIWSLDLR
ncbi:MAG TPA: hypothetical protein PL093_01415 [Candidatus Pacearchaeota archaeon]|nr:hypothetical protein [Candidatus Pacearchaeota archaeon]HQK58559.1 hypothetical protein [Candidatus Pacearchaeota archaeon]HRR94845.1 hypothetical protein [Candidatus Paceibacterota bacterium]